MDNILRLRTVKLINSLMHPLVTEGVGSRCRTVR